MEPVTVPKRSLSEISSTAVEQPTFSDSEEDMLPKQNGQRRGKGKKPKRATKEEFKAHLEEAAAGKKAAIAEANAFPAPLLVVAEKQLDKESPGKIDVLIEVPLKCIYNLTSSGKYVDVIMPLDVSPSMTDESAGGMDCLVQALMKLPAMLLKEYCTLNIRVHIFTFADTVYKSPAHWLNVTAADFESAFSCISREICSPYEASGTNHEAAMKHAYEMVDELAARGDSALAHIVILTDGNATDGVGSLGRPHDLVKRFGVDMELDKQDKQVVVHALTLGTECTWDVPEALTKPTGGILATASNPSHLSEEMSRIFSQIVLAPVAAVVKITFAGKTWYTRMGLLTDAHRHLLIQLNASDVPMEKRVVGFDNLILAISVAGSPGAKHTFNWVNKANMPTEVEVPQALKDELEARKIELDMKRKTVDALQLPGGVQAATELARATLQREDVASFQPHLQARFHRRIGHLESLATLMSTSIDPEEIELLGDNQSSLVADAVFSQSQY